MKKIFSLIAILSLVFSPVTPAFAAPSPQNVDNLNPVQNFGDNGDPTNAGAFFSGDNTLNVADGDNFGSTALKSIWQTVGAGSNGTVNFAGASELLQGAGDATNLIKTFNIADAAAVIINGDAYVATTNVGAGSLDVYGSLTGNVIFGATSGTTGLVFIGDGGNFTGDVSNVDDGEGSFGLQGVSTVTGDFGASGQSLYLLEIGDADAGGVGGGGTVNMTGDIFSTTITFQQDNTLALADGFDITGDVTTQYGGKGILQFEGSHTITGNIGTSAKLLNVVNLDGGALTTVAFSGDIEAATVNINGGSLELRSGAVSADLAGTGDLKKTTAGTVTLSGANTYTGDTTLTAGTLSVGVTENLGDVTSDLIFNGGTLQITGTALTDFSTTIGHTVSFNAGKTVGLDIDNVANVFTADQVFNQTTGGLTKSGSGTLILNQVNTYTGATTINAGTVIATNSNQALGTGAASLTMSGGKLQLANDTDLNFARNTTVTASSEIDSGRATAGTGVGTTHTLGTLSIGNYTLTAGIGDTLTTSGTQELKFGAVTLTDSAIIETGTLMPAGGTGLLTLGDVASNGKKLTLDVTGGNPNSAVIAINMGSMANLGGGNAAGLIITDTYGLITTGALGADTAGAVVVSDSAAGVTFGSTVNANEVVISDTAAGSTIKFLGNLTVGFWGMTVTGTANAYNVSITGTTNSITGDTNFLNTGLTTIGNDNTDSSTFTGGLGAVSAGGVSIAGTVATIDSDMDLGAVTMTDDSSLSSGTGIINLASITDGAGSFALSLGSGTQTGTITVSGSAAVDTLTTFVSDYDIALQGATNVITTDTTFLNTGAVTLGQALGTTTFTGGLDARTDGGTNIAGTVATTNERMDLGATTMIADSTLTSGSEAIFIRTMTDGAGPFVLSLGSGTQTGAITFVNNVAFDTLTTFASAYNIAFQGTTTTIDTDTSFLNTGIVTLGYDGTDDITTFTGGLDTTTGPTDTYIAGTVATTNNQMDLGAITILSDSTLTSGGGVINIASVVTGGKRLTVDAGSGASAIAGVFSGTGSLTKAGTGTLTLSGANTYTGGVTTISAGIINLGVAEVVGVSGPLGKSAASNPGSIVLDGGYLQYSASNQNDYSGRFSTAASQQYNVDTNGESVTWATALTSSGGSLIKDGAGALILSGDNTYTGLTTLTSGTLTLTGDNGSASGGVRLDSGTLNINSVNALGAGTLTINGGTIDNTSGDALILATNNDQEWNSSFTFGGSDDLDLGTGDVWMDTDITVTSNGGTLKIGGDIDDSSSGYNLTKEGPGALTLSGSNTYSGKTILKTGTLNIDSTTALGMGNFIIKKNTTIDNTSGTALTLTTDNKQTWDGNFTFKGTNDLNLGTGKVTLSGSRNITVDAGNLTVGGKIDDNTNGYSLNKKGDGALTLSGANTYGGGTTLSAGTLNVDSKTALGTGDFTIKSNTTIDNTSGKAHTLINGNNQYWNGDFTFTGTNNLNLGTGSVTLGGNRTVTVNGGKLTVDGAINDSSSGYRLTKEGVGILDLGGDNSGMGGGVTLNAGTLNINNINALGTGTFVIDDYASVGTTIKNTSGGALILANNISQEWRTGFTFTGANDLDLGAGNVTMYDSITITTDGSVLTVGGAINDDLLGSSQGYSLTKAGSGTLTLSGANSYTGTTTINGGLLRINGTDSSSAVNVTAGAIGGIGTIGGAVTISNAAGIDLWDGVVGTLTLGIGSDLNIKGISGANNLKFDLGSIGSTGSDDTDKITVAFGDTTVDNTGAAVISFNQIGGATSRIADDIYDLILASNPLTPTDFVLATTKAFGLTFSLDVLGNNLQVTTTQDSISPATSTWTGLGADASWGDALNWSDGAPGYNSDITFYDAAATVLDTELGEDFDINSLTYSTDAISDTTISGAYMLTIEANGVDGITVNTPDSGTPMNTISANVGLAAGQTWTVNSGGALDVTGAISDFGNGFSLTKSGAGTLTLSGANTYTGSTIITEGTLSLSGSSMTSALIFSGIGFGTGTATLADGFNLDVAVTTTAGSGTGTLTFLGDSTVSKKVGASGSELAVVNAGADGKLVTFNKSIHAYNLNFSNTTAGNDGTITFADGVNYDAAGSTGITTAADGVGILTLNGSSTIDAQVGSGGAYLSTININGASGTTVDFSGDVWAGVLSLVNGGSITGAGTLTCNETFDLRSGSISNVLAGSGILNKTTAGTVTLSGANTFTGLTTVSAGELDLNTAGSNAIAGDMAVSGGTLKWMADDQVDDGATVTMTSGAMSLNGAHETIDTFENSGGTFTTGIDGHLKMQGVLTLTWSGGTNTINDGGIVEGDHIVITGGTNTVQGGVTGGVLQRNAGGAGLEMTGATLTLNSDNSVAGTLLLKDGVNTYASAVTSNISNGPGGTNSGTIDLDSGSGGNRTFTVADGVAVEDLVISAVIKNGGLGKGGDGTLTLSGANTYAGGTILGAGTLNINNATAIGTGTFDIGGGSIDNTSGADITLTPDNLITLSNNFTFTGTNSLNLGAGAVTLGGANTITVSANTLTIGGNISDGGGSNLAKAGDGTLVLSGANTFTGATTVSAGTLTLNGLNGAIASSSGVTVSNGATLKLDNTATANNGNRIGAVGVTMNGGTFNFSNDGEVLVAGAADFSETAGALTIGTGTNTISTSQAKSGRTSTLTFASLAHTAGSTVDFSGTGLGVNAQNRIFFTTDPTLTPGLWGSWVTYNSTGFADYDALGNGVIEAAYVNIANCNSTIVDGATTNVRINFEGTDPLIPIDLDPGTTQINTLLQNWTSAATVNTVGSTLETSSVMIASGKEALTIGVAVDDGQLTALTNGGELILNNNSTYALTVNAVIADNGAASSLTKDGTGTAVLTGTNTYAGQTTIDAGVLNIRNDNALGTVDAGTFVTSGAALQMQGDITTLAEALTLNGTGVSNNGALRNISGANDYTGLVTLGSATRINSDSGTLTLSNVGTITGAGFGLTVGGAGATVIDSIIGTSIGTLTKDGAGTLTLIGANTYTGLTTVSGGELDLNSSGTAIAGDLTVSGGTVTWQASEQVDDAMTITLTSGSVDLNGMTETMTAFSNSGGIFTTGAGHLTVSGGPITVTFSGGTNTINDGGIVEDNHIVISGGTNTVEGGAAGGVLQLNGLVDPGDSLEMSGGSTLTLNSDDTTAGKLLLKGDVSTSGDSTVTIASGGSASTAGTIDLDGGTRIFTVADGAAATDIAISAVITNGNLTKAGAGAMTLSGANTHTDTTLNDGTLNINNANALGTGAFVINGGTIDNTSGSALTLLNNNAQNWNGDFTFTGTNNLNLGTGAVTLGGSRTVTVSGGDLTVGGVIDDGFGGFGITKEGAGTLTLNGVNTYTGATTINAGTLAFGSNTTLGGNLSLGGAGTLDLQTYTSNVGGTFSLLAGETLRTTLGGGAVVGNLTATTVGSIADGTLNVVITGTPTAGTYTVVTDTASGGAVDADSLILTKTGGSRFTLALVPGATQNNLQITVTGGSESFQTIATNGNAGAVGAVLDEIAAGNPTGDMANVINTLDTLSEGEIENAEDTMHPDMSSGSVEGGRALTGQGLSMVSNRLGGARNGGATGSGVSSGEMTDGVGVWIQGLGSHIKQDTRKGIEGFKANTFGTTIGADKVLDNHWRLGLAGGYGWAGVKSKTPGSPSDNINSYQGIIYGSFDSLDLNKARQGGKKSYEAVRSQVEDSWYVDGMFSFTQNDYDSRREIWLGTTKRVAKADHGAQQYATNFEAGYKFVFEETKKLEVTPFVSLGYNYLYMNKYKEDGANALNLTVNGEGFHQLEQGLGTKLAYPIVAKKVGTFIPSAKAAWLYDYIGDRFETTASFAGGGPSFSSQGAKPAKNGMLFGAELAFLNKGNMTMTGNWDIELKDQFMSNTYYGTVRYDF